MEFALVPFKRAFDQLSRWAAFNERPATTQPTPASTQVSGFTLRALLAGLAIGCVLCLGNVYMGLKTNWWDSGNITAAVLGFALFSRRSRKNAQPYSLLENNITQTVAGSAAVMPPALGILSALPALDLLGKHYAPWAIAIWGFLLALFGILLAIPLRQRYLIADPLPFPSGTATAEIMQAVHASLGSARTRFRALAAAAGVGMFVTWFRDATPAFIPAAIWLPFQLAGTPAAAITLGFGISPALSGIGMLVGLQTGLSMLAGSLLAFGVLAPWLVQAGICKPEFPALVSWLLWPGVAMMTTSSLLSLALNWRTLVNLRAKNASPQAVDSRHGVWLASGTVALGLVLLTWFIFGVHPLLGLGVVLLSTLLMGACVRAAGETGIPPVGALGQLVQLLLGLVAPGLAAVNIASASIVAGAGVQASLSVDSMKAGVILNAPPRALFLSQALGALAGILVAVPAYVLVKSAYGIGTEILPAPGALPWKALAEIAEARTSALPAFAGFAAVLGGILGIALTALERTRLALFLPSPVALAAAFFLPGTLGIAIGLSAVVWRLIERRLANSTEQLASSIAAGGIAGESLMGIFIALLLAIGIIHPG